MENNIEVPQKLKIRLSYDPAIPLLSIYLKEAKSVCWRNIHALVFIVALFKVQDMESTQGSINRWSDKENVI